MEGTEVSNIKKAMEMFMAGSTPKEVSESLGVPAETARTWKSRHFKANDSEIETAFQELKREYETLETAFQNLKRSETAFQELKRTSETTFQELKRSETAFQNLKRDHETAFQNLKRSETAFQNLKREHDTLETAFQNLKRKSETDETAFQDLKRQIVGLQSQLKYRDTTATSSLSSQQEILTNQINELKADKHRLKVDADKAADKFDKERQFLTAETKNAVKEENDRVSGVFSAKIAEKDAEISRLSRLIAADTEGTAAAVAEKDAEIALLQAEIDHYAARLAVKWYQKISQFDVVNILSNGVALFDITNLLKFHPMSFPIALALVLAFWGALKTLKKAESLFGAIGGMIGVIAIECVYGFVFTIFLKDVLHDRENLGEGITPNAVAFYASCIFAAASVFAAFMTLLKTIDIIRAATKKAAKVNADNNSIPSRLNPVTT